MSRSCSSRRRTSRPMSSRTRSFGLPGSTWRSRAAAGWPESSSSAARSSTLPGRAARWPKLRAAEQPGCLRLLARGGVAVERPAGGRLVDRAHELAMLCGSTLLVPFGDRSLQALCQGLDRRAVAEVLEPLPSRGPDTFLLLLDVGHDVKTPAPRAGRS